jgi:hypothetical protein
VDADIFQDQIIGLVHDSNKWIIFKVKAFI